VQTGGNATLLCVCTDRRFTLNKTSSETPKNLQKHRCQRNSEKKNKATSIKPANRSFAAIHILGSFWLCKNVHVCKNLQGYKGNM